MAPLSLVIRGDQVKRTRGIGVHLQETVIIVKGGILNRSNSLNECEISSLRGRVGKGREGRGKKRGGVKDCLIRGGRNGWIIIITTTGIRWKRVKREVEVENGLRKGKEGKGWEESCREQGGEALMRLHVSGTCTRVAFTFVLM